MPSKSDFLVITWPPRHVRRPETGEVSSPLSWPARTGVEVPLRWRRSCTPLLPLALLLIGLSALVGGCGTLPERLVSNPCPAAARLQAGGSIDEEVDRLAKPLIDSGELYGLAVGVLTPNGRVSSFGYGRVGGIEGSRQPGGDTIFQIGSVSKVFVTALLELLVEEGVLRYDDTVRGILPPGVQVKQELGKVTLYELATGTGGLPRQPLCPSSLRDFLTFLFTGRNLYAFIDKPYLYNYLRKKRVKPKAARCYVYSNIGFGLLTHLIEIKTGRPYPELLEEKICRPLQLRDTTFVLSEEQKRRLAIGHAGGQPRFLRRGRPMEPWDMGDIMRPSSCLYSTVNNLLTFTQSGLGLLHHPLEPVLASTQRMRLSGPEGDVALGWLIRQVGEDHLRVTYKKGVVAGYSGFIGLEPQSPLAVVVLCNTFTWDDRIGYNLLSRLARAAAPGRPGVTPWRQGAGAPR
jgi:CubicO group peptidase (beta-lactamase class C family)